MDTRKVEASGVGEWKVKWKMENNTADRERRKEHAQEPDADDDLDGRGPGHVEEARGDVDGIAPRRMVSTYSYDL